MNYFKHKKRIDPVIERIINNGLAISQADQVLMFCHFCFISFHKDLVLFQSLPGSDSSLPSHK